MRSNRLMTRQIQNLIEKALPLAQKAKDVLSLGMQAKQWLACVMICAMLLPIFSLPVGASLTRTGNTNSTEFEPVNENLSVWANAWRNLNAEIESWTTPYRFGNTAFVGDDDDKKRKKKEKEVKPEVKNDQPAAAETTVGNSEKKSKKNTELDSKNASSVKVTSKLKAENSSKNSLQNKISAASASLLLNQLPDDERESVFNYENNLGAPPGQVEKDSSNEAAAIRIRHRAGIANFSFGIPLAGLSGRGINAGAGMTYNSRTWNKSCSEYDSQGNCAQNHFTYDVEQSWIAPGFSSGFGYLETSAIVQFIHPHQSSNFTYHTEIVPNGTTDADGTRHQFACAEWIQLQGTYTSKCTMYRSHDGTFIKIPAQSWVSNPGNAQTPNTANYLNTSFTATYPNGTTILYSGGMGSGTTRKHYPVRIQDSNGNRIRIAYKSDQSGRIDFITDTLNRQIKFYYENDANGNPDKLVTVTIPGMETNEEIQTVRFYYDEMPLPTDGFVSGSIVTAPSMIRVLKYVYMPATKTGYKYEYHPKFGMIKKITRQVGMSGSTSATNTTGSLTEGILAASTEYDYPSGVPAVTDVPKYSKRTDDWQGRTSSLPQETLYNAPEPEWNQDIVSQITVKDNGFDVMTETLSYNTADWQSGLVKETSVKRIAGGSFPEKLMSKTKYFWEQGTWEMGRRTPRLAKIETTNEAGLTKATDYLYDQYNNQTRVREYDYAAPGTLGTLLRTTEIEYETGASWINNNLLGLTKSVKTIVGGTTVSKTLYEYDHNGNDSTIVRRSDIDQNTHSRSYNPDFPAWTETVCPFYDESQNALSNGCVVIHHPGYSSASAYRGNVTKVTGFSDATLTTDPNADVTNYNYDIAGNMVSGTLSCCSLRTYIYRKEEEYAFPVSQTSGTSPTQLTTSATYNRNTGLMMSSTDENNQVTNYEYETDTLRQKKVIYPNGGYVLTEYSDKLITNTADLLPGFVRTTTTLDTNKNVQSYNYFNGRGLGIRSAAQTPDGWSVSAAEFDKLGRPVKSYNPFYVSTPTGAIPAGTKFTEVLGYDALGRTTEVRLQDMTTVSTEFSDNNSTPSGFAKTFVTVTDQAGKKRRQVADSLGRIVRVDEPDANGNLGAVDNPAQPTVYEYDGNDNLSKVAQADGSATQERLFKYDSLSRLTHEKQVEAIATLNNSGMKVESGGLWTKVLKYDSQGLLTDGYDANGVNTHFVYDGLNRVSSVTFAGETGYQTPAINYTYDEDRAGFYNKGQLTKVTTAAVGGTQNTPATEQIYDFDKMGRVVKHQQKIDNQSYLLEYGYNLAGQLVSEKYPSGRIVNIGYDGGGRLSTVADANRTYLSGVLFGNRTLPSQMNFGNGTNQSFGFNDRLQMENQTLSRGSEIVQKYDYGYGQIDANGNLDTAQNNGQLARIESYIGTAKQWTQKFRYDSIGRLKESEERRGDTNALTYKQVFDYDRFGNLYRKNASNPTTGQENPLPFAPIEDADIIKEKNRFTAASGTAYNDAGQVISDNKFRQMNFAYDANGRMVKATRANTPDAVTVYDALGNRVAQKVQDVWQFIIYDAFGKIVAEYGGLQATDEGGIKYVLSDWQGSVRAILNNSGYVQSRTDYQAFGEEINSGIGLRNVAQGFGGGVNTKQGYGLTERDDSTGLNHTWFRKNENSAGRWTSPDPYNGSMRLNNPQSFNRFSYAQNQPTNYVDPSGLQVAIFRCYQSCTDPIFDEPRECETHCVLVADFTWGGGRTGGDPFDVFLGGGVDIHPDLDKFGKTDDCDELKRQIKELELIIAKRKRINKEWAFANGKKRADDNHLKRLNNTRNTLDGVKKKHKNLCDDDDDDPKPGPEPVTVPVPVGNPKNIPLPRGIPVPRTVTPSLPILIIPEPVIQDYIRRMNEMINGVTIDA